MAFTARKRNPMAFPRSQRGAEFLSAERQRQILVQAEPKPARGPGIGFYGNN